MAEARDKLEQRKGGTSKKIYAYGNYYGKKSKDPRDENYYKSDSDEEEYTAEVKTTRNKSTENHIKRNERSNRCSLCNELGHRDRECPDNPAIILVNYNKKNYRNLKSAERKLRLQQVNQVHVTYVNLRLIYRKIVLP